eukprot:SAG22_NODE_6249_length_879_cov_2.826923_1_plen_109_part_10
MDLSNCKGEVFCPARFNARARPKGRRLQQRVEREAGAANQPSPRAGEAAASAAANWEELAALLLSALKNRARAAGVPEAVLHIILLFLFGFKRRKLVPHIFLATVIVIP